MASHRSYRAEVWYEGLGPDDRAVRYLEAVDIAEALRLLATALAHRNHRVTAIAEEARSRVTQDA